MRRTHGNTMGMAALIMAGSVLLSRLMGLVRDKVIAHLFGASAEADMYFAAFVVPDFLNYLLAGGYVAITLIPLLAERFENDPDDAWRLFSTVLLWTTLAIFSLTLVVWVLAPQIAPLIAPGFDAGGQARLAYFLRLILPAQVFFLPGACLSAILYVRKQFFVPAMTPLVYNACIIVGGLIGVTFDGSGMTGFCVGVTVGAFLGALLLPLVAVARQGMRLCVSWRHKAFVRFLWLALPLMLGQSIVVLDEQLLRVFGSLAGEGAVSLLNYARRLMMVPVGVVAQAASVASYPFLAALMARGDRPAFDATLGKALGNTLLVVIPLSGLLAALASPLLGVLFESGHFTAMHNVRATPLLQLMLLAVPCWAVQQLIGRAFYATQNTVTPAVVGTVTTVCVLPLYFWGTTRLGALGVAGATSLSVMAYTLVLLVAWGRAHGVGAFAGLCRPIVRGVCLTVPCALGAAGIAGVSPAWLAAALPALGSWWGQVLVLCAGTLAFVIAYAGLAALFLPEWRAVARFGRKRSG